MTRDEIKAEFKKFLTFSHPDVKAIDFAEHIAKLEREECALLADKGVSKAYDEKYDPVTLFAANLAKAIRARGNK